MQPDGTYAHVPVLSEEVAAWLGPALRGRGTLVDCTLGGGGHSEKLLTEYRELRLVGIDRDDEALAASQQRLRGFSDRVRFVKANFADLAQVVGPQDDPVKGVLYDLGVSSPQLDRSDRGFQYRGDGPLDMRMDVSNQTTAADIVNSYSESELTQVISTFGEERFARRIARAIVRRRTKRPLTTTRELAEVITGAYPPATRRRGAHPARRTFQALRIELNQELESLERSLPAAIELVAAGGRIAVISYHSLEDRITKRTFAQSPSLKVLTKKPVRAGEDETQVNRRSKSGRLRVAEKLSEEAA